MGIWILEARSVDLHAHTTASDGDHTPTQLVRKAKEVGLTALAITDHDTTDGVAEALEAGATYGIEIVPGIELSAEFEKGQCHILGLWIDPASKPLLSALRIVQEARAHRNDQILGKIRAAGFEITLDEVKQVAGGDIVARPHFAKALLQKGHVASIAEAFDKYLGKGASFYVDRVRLQPEECIALIHAAGGVAILAHPNNLKRDIPETEAEIARLQAMGLDGIEARYNRHTPEDNTRYLALAERLGLLTSGGSDFHGPTVKPTVSLGEVEGTQPAPNALLAALKARAANC
jgi:predicted metal-dependent phosphoesterase TrpH